MKYLRVFNNDAEYQQFKESSEYVTPNICLNRDTNGIKCEAYIPPPPMPVLVGDVAYWDGSKWKYLHIKEWHALGAVCY